MSAKKVTRKKAAKKKATTKKKATKKKAARKMAAAARMPRREDVPGIAAGLPDFADFREAARALKVRPFFAGPGSVPFSRLRATQIRDPARGPGSFNDFFLAQG
jgi:hypothetical protein